MIKFSDRLGMFWWHRESAIRCFLLLIVVHNLLYTLKTATTANNLCYYCCYLSGERNVFSVRKGEKKSFMSS